MADSTHQEDPTTTMSIDEKITVNTATAPATFDITVPVVPGHDMVINHLDGIQELGTGNEAVAVAAKEAETGTHVPLSDVQPQPAEVTHRSVPDPETNQPNPAVAPPATEEPETPVEPEVPVEAETPVETPSDSVASDPQEATPSDEPDAPEETPTEAPAESTEADV
jgi:hypothetical protein